MLTDLESMTHVLSHAQHTIHVCVCLRMVVSVSAGQFHANAMSRLSFVFIHSAFLALVLDECLGVRIGDDQVDDADPSLLQGELQNQPFITS